MKSERNSGGQVTQRQKRVVDLLKTLAAEYLKRESDRSSMVTVTRATISKDLKNATIFFTVFPEESEKAALDFIKRKRSDFRKYVRTRSELKRLPFFDFTIDEGEKNRQHIDELTKQ